MTTSTRLIAAGCVLALAGAAHAGMIIDLGGGWQATLLDEDVDIFVDYVSIEEDILVIQKFADFNAIDPFTGQPVPRRIAFSQIASDDDTVSRIVITDELIFNNSGLDWTSYTNALLGANVAFDPVASADFSIDPFTVRTYNGDNTAVTFSGGLVEDGTSWTPGLLEGGLVINVDLSDDDAINFVLKESAVPAPGALVLLGLAGLARRRRRA